MDDTARHVEEWARHLDEFTTLLGTMAAIRAYDPPWQPDKLDFALWAHEAMHCVCARDHQRIASHMLHLALRNLSTCEFSEYVTEQWSMYVSVFEYLMRREYLKQMESTNVTASD